MEIKYGTTRTVFMFKNFVIKIPSFTEYRLFLYGLISNKNEQRIYKDFKYDFLCPVYYCTPLGFMLFMERANCFQNTDNSSLNVKNKLKTLYEKSDLYAFIMSDFKVSNFGLLNNRIVKIDYGQ